MRHSEHCRTHYEKAYSLNVIGETSKLEYKFVISKSNETSNQLFFCSMLLWPIAQLKMKVDFDWASYFNATLPQVVLDRLYTEQWNIEVNSPEYLNKVGILQIF